MDNLTIGSEYKVSPSQIRFDQTTTEFNRTYNMSEYEATLISIKENGQLFPIYINSETGLCEDGRHRTRICKELGIDVKCIEIDGNKPLKDRLVLYNADLMSGRDLTTAQRAVQAHKYYLLTGSDIKLNQVAKMFKVGAREVQEANTIAGLGKQDVLDAISKEGHWQIPGSPRPSKSLRAIASHLKSIAENVEVSDNTTPSIDYTDMINTEKGKSEYYGLVTLAMTSNHELRLMIVQYLNLKYKLKINPKTGEVTEPTQSVDGISEDVAANYSLLKGMYESGKVEELLLVATRARQLAAKLME